MRCFGEFTLPPFTSFGYWNLSLINIHFPVHSYVFFYPSFCAEPFLQFITVLSFFDFLLRRCIAFWPENMFVVISLLGCKQRLLYALYTFWVPMYTPFALFLLLSYYLSLHLSIPSPSLSPHFFPFRYFFIPTFSHSPFFLSPVICFNPLSLLFSVPHVIFSYSSLCLSPSSFPFFIFPLHFSSFLPPFCHE